jgi:N-methylhydantoinase A
MSTSARTARLAIDIGGTFTDLALAGPDGIVTTKLLTTMDAPERAVIEGARAILAEARIAPDAVRHVIHGTTLATNALIERKGARMAFITTEGFRDTLEIATEGRFDVYDLDLDLPAPLVPRRLRLEVPERMSAKGRVLRPLDEAAIDRLVTEVLDPERIEAVAVGLLHAYANHDHEQRVRDRLTRLHPGLSVSLSSEVSPEMREYERFSTTCANAYVQPLVGRYLRGLRRDLDGLGVRCPLFLMLSGGGLTDLETAIRFPVRLVESGPAGGAVFAAEVARELGLNRVVSFDMGGTTAKICLIDDHAAQTARVFEAARVYRTKKGSGIPLRVPVIELVEIGAGGGSLAWLDHLGRLSIGPESAGANPGPACYGQGGRDATVTDADAVLGKFDPALFAGGRVRLDLAAAEEALGRTVGGALKLDPRQAARAVCEVVDNNMATAARIHAIESGKDTGGRALIAFGGAAPLHAARVAAITGIETFVVPRFAGVGSCIGFLRAPVAFEVVQSHYQRLDGFDTEAFMAVVARLSAAVRDLVGTAGRVGEERRLAYMRYVGQGSEIAVNLENVRDAADLLRAFEAEYGRQYDRLVPGGAAELISISVHAIAADRHDLATEMAPGAPGPRGSGGSAVRRDALAPGATLRGPVLIIEEQTSTVVPEGWGCAVSPAGHLVVSRDKQGTIAP